MTTRRHWTPQEDRILIDLWQDASERRIVESLPGRTWTAIYQRAHKLGLPQGIPQGCESMKHAAERAGFAPQTLTKILEWYGVRIRNCYRMPRTPQQRRKTQRTYVEISDVDDAVAAYLQHGNITEVAARLGVSKTTLALYLREAGLTQPSRRGVRHLVSVEVARRVIAERKAQVENAKRQRAANATGGKTDDAECLRTIGARGDAPRAETTALATRVA